MDSSRAGDGRIGAHSRPGATGTITCRRFDPWPARAIGERPCRGYTASRFQGGPMAEAAEKEQDTEVGGIAADRLRSIIERVERLEEERKALASDIKDIYAEAKSAGFDVKVIRQIISIRKQEPAEVEEQETLLDLYRRALGM
jgi:uncharacterized protein (UPF0335 family)